MVGEYEEEPFDPGARENTVDALAILLRDYFAGTVVAAIRSI